MDSVDESGHPSVEWQGRLRGCVSVTGVWRSSYDKVRETT
jgi:hypothetical protein